MEDLFAPTTWLLVSESVAETSPTSALLSVGSLSQEQVKDQQHQPDQGAERDEGDRCLVHSGENHQMMPLRNVEPDRVPSGHRPPAIQQQAVPFDEAIPKVAGVLSVVLQPLLWLPLEGLVVELVVHHRRQCQIKFAHGPETRRRLCRHGRPPDEQCCSQCNVASTVSAL